MILHVDMDAFFAAVEIWERPELATQPVIVGGSPEGRGVVSAANYIAREYGIRSAMPAATAKRLCPHAVFLKGNFALYREVSQQIRKIFAGYTHLIEPLSLDEAFLDVSEAAAKSGSVEAIGRRIKQQIREELNLVASVGVAPNKFLAKIASDWDKPDGFFVLPKDRVQDFLDPLPVKRLWGVGPATEKRLHELGIQTVCQLRQTSEEVLVGRLKSLGRHLLRLAVGKDDRPVVPDHEVKGVSHETTFQQDETDREVLNSHLLELTEKVSRRLEEKHKRAHTMILKVRFHNFHTLTRRQKLTVPTRRFPLLAESVLHLFETRFAEPLLPIRLLGVGTADLCDDSRPVQQLLFEGCSEV